MAAFLSILFFSIFVSAGEAELKERIENAIAKSGLEKKDLGVVVTTHSGQEIFSLNKENGYIPASLTKIFTAIGVLETFQSTHRFRTQLWAKGRRFGKQLQGDLYLKGLGDPAFVSEKMWMLVNEFTKEQITKIKGDLVVDDTYFDNERFDKRRDAGGNDRAYDSPVGAMSFNWNSTTIAVRPGKKSKDKGLVFIDPPNSYIEVDNRTVTSSGSTSLTVIRLDGKNGDTIRVSGTISSKDKEKIFYKSISKPDLYAGANLKEFLAQRGIIVEGSVKTGKVPSDAELVVDFEGEPLNKILGDLMKFSNNFVAEMLTKNISAHGSSETGTMDDGLEKVRKIIDQKLEFDSASYTLNNVSGLTRRNRFTAEQIAKALVYLYQNFHTAPEFLSSLPISGIDGTLERRMTEIKGRVRAKTGLLNGTVGLAGYIGSEQIGDTLVFVFLYNGKKDGAVVRSTFDRWAGQLVR